MTELFKATIDDLYGILGKADAGSPAHREATAELSRRQIIETQRSVRRTAAISTVSALASVFSALTALTVGILTWQNNRATSTVDIVRKHLIDPQIAEGRQIALKMIVLRSPEILHEQANNAAFNQYVIDAQYLADLLEKRQIDRALVNDLSLCDIWFAMSAVMTLPAKPDPSPFLTFAKSLDPLCASKLKVPTP